MFLAGATVRGGYYFNRDELDLIAVAGKEGTLPGAEGQRYHRVSAFAVIGLTPLLGALCVVLVPVTGVLLAIRRGFSRRAAAAASR